MNARALSSHVRVKHAKVSDDSHSAGKSRRCCVCSTLFSSRTRLVAHLSDKRCRGQRAFNCRQVVMSSGFVRRVDKDEYEETHKRDRHSRTQARKRGHTQPLSICPAKRAKPGSTFLMAARECANTDELPSNHLDWERLPPAKRLRGKTPIDIVMSQWIFNHEHSRTTRICCFWPPACFS